MIPCDFPESNHRFGPPSDMDDSQCGAIQAYVGEVQGGNNDGTPIIVTAWQPTEQELMDLVNGGCVYLTIIGQCLPPHTINTSFEAATLRA